MRLLEHEAKGLLKKYSLPIPQGVLIKNVGDDASRAVPIVLKSQVPIGGRGKAGGIKIVNNQDEVAAAVNQLFQLRIGTHMPSSLLAEEKLDIASEHYLSLLIDRDSSSIQLLAHHDGGIEVESADSNKLFRQSLVAAPDRDITEEVVRILGASSDLNSRMHELLTNLWQCFVSEDATLVEINPLVITTDGHVVCGDSKIELDDNAAFRHEWTFEAGMSDQNYVVLDPDGEVATLANGAGLAMATVDTVSDAGLKVANFLDIGGGTNEATATRALERLCELPKLRAIIVNIFAGITRSDEVARAIVSAQGNIADLPPLFIRIEGNKQREARAILEAHDIPFFTTLEQCIAAAKKELET